MYRVMIVEDEMLVRLGLKNSIQWDKFDMCVIADLANGKQALDFCQKEMPDLIITDIKMPEMDGMELIQRIREKDDGVAIIILTCLEEFDLIKKAMSFGVVDYILKLSMTEDEIESVLRKVQGKLQDTMRYSGTKQIPEINAGILKEKLLKDFLFFNILSNEDFERAVVQLGLNLNPGRLQLCVMEFDDYEQLRNKFHDEKGQLIEQSMLNIGNEILKAGNRGELFCGDENHFILLFSYNGLFSEQAALQETLDTVNHIRTSAAAFFGASVSAGISSIRSGYASLKALYSEAGKLLDQKFVMGNGLFLKNDRVRMEAAVNDRINRLKNMQELTMWLNEESLKEYHEKIDRMKGINPAERESVKEYFGQLLHWVAGNLHVKNDSSQMLVSCIHKIGRCDTVDGILLIFGKFVAGLAEKAMSNKVKSREIDEAIQFIKLNYNSYISLQRVAEQVNLSTAYISYLFKKELQINFIDFVNGVRVDKARELLLETYLKSYEIAEKVGFSDHTYFSRVFKKVTGMSPNEYRKQWVHGWKEEADE
jgi:YesN/AraC family two-component response regulator